MIVDERTRYQQITSGRTVYEADGRTPRPEGITYREALDATYQGPYTKGKLLRWDGLVGNEAGAGLVGHDPELGFDLTMPAGQATDRGYTTRDIATAPHGVDYRPHFAEWEHDRTRHPNLVMPGRTIRFHGVRMGALALAERLLGTGGCIVQDWVGLDFPTMERRGMDDERYTGGGFLWLPPSSALGATAIRAARLRRRWPFQDPIAGAAPVMVMFARLKGFVVAGTIWLDPALPHEFAIHRTPDGEVIELWADRRCVTRVQEGRAAIPAGVRTRGRVRLHRSGLHGCCWQDNNDGGTEVAGYAGNPDEDQPLTIERLEIIETSR